MMKKMAYQNVKGTQDYLPKAETIRRTIRQTLEQTFITYGYQPLETPILNYTDLLASKYAGGAEILKEMYCLSDQGSRDLALRYDLTIPFAKVIGLNPSLKMPFKRYEIGKVFRDGPIKTGRLREFTQCDVDITGTSSILAEAELMLMALDAFKKLDLKVTIQYNNRKLLTGLLATLDTPPALINETILILDKLEKIGTEGVMSELMKKNLPSNTVQKIKRFVGDSHNIDLTYLKNVAGTNETFTQGLEELEALSTYLTYLNVDDKCSFNPFLARGLDIYTGTVYEVFLTDSSITSSIGSGGRYDRAIGGLIGGDDVFPTVGLSFGLDVIYTALKERDSDDDFKSEYLVLPVTASTTKEALVVAQFLRAKGYQTNIEMSGRKLSKVMERANKDNIRYVVVIGEDEVQRGMMNVKDMSTGKTALKAFNYGNPL
ncbi:histidine--tRNA ligase [Salipaludibacillus sp. LMS25]|jgi:histidyl-tRNA synthetase|uniref:histidine--tRNA ligase n=1 Tax=Salipaludibacillus sp. LMS25 TaxID=2924031 RepID=UPI0034E97BAD